MPVSPLLVVGIAALLLGCEDGGSTPEGEGAAEAGGEAGGEGGGEGEGEGAAFAPDPPPTLRRLSHGEYVRTVADLFAPVAVPEQRFAADARVHGFDNQARSLAPSPILVEQRRAAAVQIAEAVGSAISLGCPSERDEACVLAWTPRFLARAFRGPVNEEDAAVYGELASVALAAGGPDLAVRIVIEVALQSPRFLYRIDDGGPHAVASRLSYMLWGTMPHDALRKAAAAGELSTEGRVRAWALDMIDDPRARAQVLDFHRQWLGLDALRGLNKDAWDFPEWNEDLKRSLREEADRFIEEAVFEGPGDLATLLTASSGPVDERLAALYGADAPEAPGEWGTASHHPGERAGLLTQGWFLATGAHLSHPSPVLRGVFVLDRLLCRRPSPPDAGIDTAPPTDEEIDAPHTNRERYAAHVADPQCAGCHADIDGIGFAFEGYDAIGAFRLDDAGEPVDATGRIMLDGRELPLNGAIDLARKLATSPEVDACVVRQWFRFTYGRDATPAEVEMLADLAPRWRFQGHRILDLLVELVVAGGIAP